MLRLISTSGLGNTVFSVMYSVSRIIIGNLKLTFLIPKEQMSNIGDLQE